MYTKKSGRMTYKTNRRPNFKRNNSYAPKGRNKGNVTQQYNKYLKLAKDTFSSGDRIQAEYYYQFTDHYYRLMLELGLNIEDQESLEESRSVYNETADLEEVKAESEDNNEKTKLKKTREVDSDINEDEDEDEDEDSDQSIESIPFIAEPAKKKRTRISK